MHWDIFCKVIDNHGDVGVCWRLCAELARRGQTVRLWVDDPSALAWMAPAGQPGVEVRHWTSAACKDAVPADVVIEAFGCELDEAFITAIAQAAHDRGRQPAWINLEYLSAENYVERCHGLASPVLSGPGKGLVKRFFYPGFTHRTGGLIREQDLDARQHSFDRQAWLHRMGLPSTGEWLVSLFCYEPQALPQLLQQLSDIAEPTRLLVTAGHAQQAVQAALESKIGIKRTPHLRRTLSISYLPLLSQLDYDHLLWSCDLNFVRGEDSLVRALWAGQPFIWQLYPQHDEAHHAKLRAFLDWLQAPASLREFHEGWNGLGRELPGLDLRSWRDTVGHARGQLRTQPDLVTQLLQAASLSEAFAPA